MRGWPVDLLRSLNNMLNLGFPRLLVVSKAMAYISANWVEVKKNAPSKRSKTLMCCMKIDKRPKDRLNIKLKYYTI